MDKIVIFDTTLRDGEQAAGGALTITEKLDIGRQLEKLGVDIIEAGFPYTSQGDFDAVELLSKKLRYCRVAGLSGFKREQIDSTWAALKGAAAPLLHVVISTSDIHLNQQLHMSREEVLELTTDAVTYAKHFCSDMEFSAMDATRSDPDYLCQVLSAAVKAGATISMCPIRWAMYSRTSLGS